MCCLTPGNSMVATGELPLSKMDACLHAPNTVYTIPHVRTSTVLPCGLSSLPCLPVSVGRSPAHSYRARFDYVLIQSSKAERAPLIFFETQNNAYWTERNMADSWTRLSPEGNIISVTEHVYGLCLHLLFSVAQWRKNGGKKRKCQLLLFSQVISCHSCFVRMSVQAKWSQTTDTGETLGQ